MIIHAHNFLCRQFAIVVSHFISPDDRVAFQLCVTKPVAQEKLGYDFVPIGALVGDNDDEALSSATVPVRSCPGTAGALTKDTIDSSITATSALIRI